MPTVSAMFAPVAPASADVGSAAPGAQAADISLFSSKIADILQSPGVDGRAARVINAPMQALAQVQMADADAASTPTDAAPSPAPIPDAPNASLDNGRDDESAPVSNDAPVETDIQPFAFMAATPIQLITTPSQPEAVAAAAKAIAAQPTSQQIAAITSDVANDTQPPAEKAAAATTALILPADLLAASADQAEIAPPVIAKAALKAAQEAATEQRTAKDDDAAASDQTADTLAAVLKGEPAPPRPLRHNDASTPRNAAVADASASVKDDSSNIQKTTLADAAPASSAARTPAADSAQPAAPTQTTAQTTQPTAPAALDAQPMQQAAAVERSLSFSRLSQATIETTAHLAAQIARSLDGKSTRFDMVLTPEDLGRVNVSLEIGDDGQLAARLSFDNPAAAAELRGRADELRRQLQDAGFQLAGDALDFNHRDQPQGGDAFERQQQRNALFGGGSRLALTADASSILTPGVWTNLSLTPDRVDMKV